MLKVKATVEGYRQWVELREKATKYNTTRRHAHDIYSTRSECTEKQCQHMTTTIINIGKKPTERVLCSLTGKIVYSRVKCPLKIEEKAEAGRMQKVQATAEGYQQLTKQVERLNSRKTPKQDANVHSSIKLCKESGCPHLQTIAVQTRKFTQKQYKCALSGKTVRAIVGCPLKEGSHIKHVGISSIHTPTDTEVCGY